MNQILCWEFVYSKKVKLEQFTKYRICTRQFVSFLQNQISWQAHYNPAALTKWLSIARFIMLPEEALTFLRECLSYSAESDLLSSKDLREDLQNLSRVAEKNPRTTLVAQRWNRKSFPNNQLLQFPCCRLCISLKMELTLRETNQ